ncbi:MAG TPA: sugar phosphate isomerase/epimerase [Bryobacteraceae bacterium]|nr:sugar phosphate isomerase/epimerase [Bryobacteraceae bacterium]
MTLKRETSRRDFAKLALAAIPASALAQAPPQGPGGPGGFGGGGRGTPPPPLKSDYAGVKIGVITYSFRQGVAANDLISIISKLGISHVELMSNHAEALAGAPAPSAFGFPGGGRGRGQMTPEQQAAAQAARKEAQDKLDAWRKSASMDVFRNVRKQFNDAGQELNILCYNLANTATDDEIDYSFQMAQALGVSAISSSTTVSVAKRVAPFADKYKLMWGGHGHDNVADPEQFATLESYDKIMSFSKYIGVNLDIGHFTAAGYDPVPYIQKHHDRITNLHLKDRFRNPPGGRGANVRWGEGQTTIKDVLLLLKKEKYPFPADIEYEYQGTDPVIEVAKCLEYCRDVLLG